MINIPKEVKVGGLIYEISFLDEIEDGSCSGLTTQGDLKIEIEKAKPSAMAQTFLHELFHCINFEMKETDIEFLAMMLYQVVIDNPEIFGKEGGENNVIKKNKQRVGTFRK